SDRLRRGLAFRRASRFRGTGEVLGRQCISRRTCSGAIGAASAVSIASKPGTDMGEDYYDKLGVTKIINAAGTYTALTASIMPPPVQAAVARAAKSPVRLADLQKAAGAYIAKKLKCGAAMAAAGAASALT